MSFTVFETDYLPKCFVEAAVKRKIEQENVTSATKYGAILVELKTKNEKLTKEIKVANIEKIKMKESVILAKLVLKWNTQVGKLEEENKKLKRDLEKVLNDRKEIKQPKDQKNQNNAVDRPLETGIGNEPVVSSGTTIFYIIAKHY